MECLWDVSSFNLSNCKDLAQMFFGCSSLKEVDVSNFHLSNLKNVWGMFEGCESLTYLDLSTFDFENAELVGNLLKGCDSLNKIETPLRLNKWCELPINNENETWYKPDGTWNDGSFKENVYDGGNAYICEWE